jgi:1-acyl-sn-glycerol-3-phosphate acyltransferase
MVHDPPWQIASNLAADGTGRSGDLKVETVYEPGVLNPALVDGITHIAPHDQLGEIYAGAPAQGAAYPAAIHWIRVYGPTPRTGVVRCESRGGPLDTEGLNVPYHAQILVNGQVWLDASYYEHIWEMGPIGALDRRQRMDFCRDRRPVPGFSVCEVAGDETRATSAGLTRQEWFPNFLGDHFAVEAKGNAFVEQIAQKDHVARRALSHPIHVTLGEGAGRAATQPLTAWPLATSWNGSTVIVRDAGPPRLDLSVVDADIRARAGRAAWGGRDIMIGGLRHFLRRALVEDANDFAALRGKNVLFLGNHQVACESAVFSAITSALSGVATAALAKIEHQQTWVGKIGDRLATYPGVSYPAPAFFFDRQNPAQLLEIFGTLRANLGAQSRSILIHVDGTRSLSCRTPTQKITQAILELAVGANLPVVPVRFVGGLPVEPAAERLELPFGCGTQDVVYGRAIPPSEIARLPFAERPRHVLAAINNLVDIATEVPNPPDPAFAARVESWRSRTGVGAFEAGIFCGLEDLPDPSVETRAILAAATTGRIDLDPATPVADWATRTAEWLGALPKR